MVISKVKTASILVLLMVVCCYAFPADAVTVTVRPSVFGSIEDSPPNGVGDRIVTFVPGAIGNVPSPPALTAWVDSAIVEYPLGAFAGRRVSSAVLSGTIVANNYLDTGDRLIDILVYGGDGLLSISDFQIPATSVGTVAYHPPLDAMVSFSIDITSVVQSVIDSGYSFIGGRFAALNVQAPSQLNPSFLPTLELTVVPEPSSLLLVVAGLVTLSWVRRRGIREVKGAERNKGLAKLQTS